MAALESEQTPLVPGPQGSRGSSGPPGRCGYVLSCWGLFRALAECGHSLHGESQELQECRAPRCLPHPRGDREGSGHSDHQARWAKGTGSVAPGPGWKGSVASARSWETLSPFQTVYSTSLGSGLTFLFPQCQGFEFQYLYVQNAWRSRTLPALGLGLQAHVPASLPDGGRAGGGLRSCRPVLRGKGFCLPGVKQGREGPAGPRLLPVLGRMLEVTISVHLGLGPSGFPNTVAAGAQVESGLASPFLSCGTLSKPFVLLVTQFSHV